MRVCVRVCVCACVRERVRASVCVMAANESVYTQNSQGDTNVGHFTRFPLSRYGYQDQWEKDSTKYPGSDFERLLPMLGLLVPEAVLDRIPGGSEHLQANQQRFVSG